MSKKGIDKLLMSTEELESMGIPEVQFRVPAKFRKGKLRGKQNQSIGSAFKIFEYIQGLLQRDDFKDMDILDFGCGVKFTQALLQKEFGIRSYFGVDVDVKMLNFLRSKVQDKRFSYQIADFQNDMYNPEGTLSISEETKLDCDGKDFDLITLQSVFTHFQPHDVSNCLLMLKKYLKPTGKMIFTCLTKEKQRTPFHDLKPDKPLLYASYSKAYFDQMIIDAGYHIEYFRKKESFLYLADHYMVSKT